MRNIESISIAKTTPIKKVIRVIDRGRLGIALVVDRNRRLLGIVTDVDVRKGLLQGKHLDSPVCAIMNRNPKKIIAGTTNDQILSLMKKYNIRQLPVVDEGRKAVGLEILNDYFGQSKYGNTVFVMAGGIGKRLYPLTKNIPKPMLTVGNKPILENLIESFKNYGFQNFILTVNYKQNKIKKYFGNGEKWGVDIKYLSEKRPLGTAGALSLLDKTRTEEPFFVVNSDLLTSVNFEHMLDYHINHECVATIGIKEYTVNIPYGTIKLHKGLLEHFEEKPAARFYINAGIYIFSPLVLKLLKKNIHIDMTNFVESIKRKGYRIVCFPIHEYWMDIGHIDNYRKANRDYRKVFK